MRACALALLLTATVALAAPPQKKLLEYGWDVPYPDYVKDNIKAMEEKPFDGLVFRIRDYNHLFDTRPWKQADLQPQIDLLKAIEWDRFTDNFLIVYAANQHGMNWFDDAQWSTIVANTALTMQTVAAARCVGVCFDAEPYGANPWAWTGEDKDHTFAQAQAAARKRGAQVMTAMQAAKPDIKILTFFAFVYQASLGRIPDEAERNARLMAHHYALYPSFLNGMLDVINPQARIIDGNESSYYYTDNNGYFRGYHAMKEEARSIVEPDNRDKFTAQVEAGMALYVDQVMSLRTTPVIANWLQPDERLKFWEHNVYWSLFSTDEYVWLYSERMNWWKGPVPEGLQQGVESARVKLAEGKPLGFDIAPLIDQAKQRQKDDIAARLKTRKAKIAKLAAGTAAPTIDGKLDDAAWQIPPLEPFEPQASQPGEIAQTTTRVTYDGTNLYVAWQCDEPLLDKLVVAGAGRDSDIWSGDVVELFCSMSDNPAEYRHFIVNPANVVWDGQSSPDGDDVSWNAEWRSATGRGDGQWTAELAIPWAMNGGMPKPGAVRRANLCRQRMPKRELSAWSTIVTGFIEPDRFGTWEF